MDPVFFKMAEPVLIFAAIGAVLAWQWWTVRPSVRNTSGPKPDQPPWWERR